MTAIFSDKPWDFSQVLELVNSLQPRAAELPRFDVQDKEKEYQNISGAESASSSDGLGDFSKIFQHLGTPIKQESPNLAVQTPARRKSTRFDQPTKDEYASDGATYSKLATGLANTVQSEQETNNEEEGSPEAVSDSSLPPDSPSLTNAQRETMTRKQRHVKKKALAAKRAARKANTSISESDPEIAKKTPASKASAHVVPTSSNPRYNLRQRDAFGKAATADPGEGLVDAMSVAVQKVQSAKKATSNDTPLNLSNQTPRRNISPDVPPSHWTKPIIDASSKHDLRGTPNSGVISLVPSSVQPPSKSTAKHSPTQNGITKTQVISATRSSHVIQPLMIRSGEDRHWALLMKLIRDFNEDRKHLIAPMNLTTHNNDPKGIHVFVDASNVFIGFNDQLKRARGISERVQTPAAGLSFDALALLIERRRPVAKRVLVGSTPHMPAFDKAKAVGYECNILEKVYKARELTERQIYFKDLDRFMNRKRTKVPPANNVAIVNRGSGSGSGSGSETNTPQYAPARMIEQGVDEILHLKILESVVDTDVPGTIVLATGDAAQAEYSEGFMAMAYRALKKGWTVELVSWSKNISAMYTKREWVQAWGDRFKVVLLDDYAEELLDM